MWRKFWMSSLYIFTYELFVFKINRPRSCWNYSNHRVKSCVVNFLNICRVIKTLLTYCIMLCRQKIATLMNYLSVKNEEVTIKEILTNFLLTCFSIFQSFTHSSFHTSFFCQTPFGWWCSSCPPFFQNVGSQMTTFSVIAKIYIYFMKTIAKAHAMRQFFV